jgi:ubiquinone/menaquinone biosynthesis C-methylase UbiE
VKPTGHHVNTPDDHAAAVERAFSRQAPAFEDARLNRVFTADIGWLFAHVDLAPDLLALDVAAGTGHVSRWLAPAVRAVVALDATTAMLEAGRVAAERAGLRNVAFQRGDAAALPFVDGSFDVVVTRFSVHHFERPGGPLAEMARCMRAGGRMVVADLIGAEDAATAPRQNELERLRDPSHTRMLAQSELAALVDGVADVIAVETRELVRPLTPWLEQTDADRAVADRIAAALRAELAAGPSTGFAPREEAGELRFVHRLACVTAAKRA